MSHRNFFPLLGLILATALPICAKDPSSENRGAVVGQNLSASVVRIEVTDQEADYASPWNAGHIGGGIGSGFVIMAPSGKKRILTNAHVVSNARFIMLTRERVSHPYTAHVEFIAHDCDLALLSVDDPAFFDGTIPLELGGVPAIESGVSVFGFKLLCERLSVTRGVVSKIDFDLYTHSGVDSHLVIQIDAAINPGNSGGPVLQDGKVVGVAFQGYSGEVAQNVGFMIPIPVISRFLKDLSKGSYTGYTDLSIAFRPLLSAPSRKVLGLPNDDLGVLVTDVQENGSSYGFLQKGDVLLSIDNHPIASNGRVELDGQSVDMTEVVEQKFEGEKVRFNILRQGATTAVEFPMAGTWPFRMQGNAYDEKPRYLLHGGLLFQPLDRNFLNADSMADLRIKRAFENFVEKHLYLQRPEIIVLSRVLADPIHKECDGLRPGIVDSINGRKIRSLADVRAAFDQPTRYDVVILDGVGVPIVLSREEALKANPRIMKTYSIPSPRNL